MSTRWNGSVVRMWRAYWAPRIVAAHAKGEPLVCPFWQVDPHCPGTITPHDTWDVDHAQPLVEQGARGLHNQAPAHTSCNRRAGQALAAARTAQHTTRVRLWA